MYVKSKKLLASAESDGWSKDSKEPDLDAKVKFNILHFLENSSYPVGARLCTVYW